MQYTMSGFILKYFKWYCDRHFPGETQVLTEKAQVIYDRLMHETPDMGGKGNMMAGNMDITAAFFAYYEASDRRMPGEAIEELIDKLANDYRWVGFFLDMNKHKYVRPLYYKMYADHAKKVEEHKARGEWTGTWSITINPDHRDEGINYHMNNCPLLAFVRSHGYDDMMPYICRFDFIFERFLHARLIRTQTEATGGACCDYWFIPDQGKLAEEYRNFKSK